MTSAELGDGVATPAAVTDRLRNDILSGTFSPGERLVELTLSRDYGVGRAAIRSALVELDKEGLVQREANRGATVRRVPIAEAVQLAEARQALEVLVAGHAASNATAEERRELGQLAERMRTAVSDEDYLGYSELNGLLHRRLPEISGHTVAADLIANLRARSSHHQFRLALRPGRPAESLPEHEAVIEAVLDGDVDGARLAMHEHLESVIVALSHWAALGVEA